MPLRVDDTNFTDLYISTSAKGTPSKVRVLYTPVSEYVSPACGMRRLYNDLSAVLENATPVKNIELNEKNVHDENKTHLYLIFLVFFPKPICSRQRQPKNKMEISA